MSLDQPKDFVKHQTLTRDAFLGGRITVSQPRHGFRAGLDSVLLGAAIAADSTALLDLGCGVGTAALVALAHKVDWAFIENTFGEAYKDGPGQPPLPTRLMAGLTILKYTHDLSDEVLCERWVENPYYQFFCGEEFFQALCRYLDKVP